MENLYTIELHYSGWFDEDFNYVGRVYRFVEKFDPDRISYLELEDMLEMVGCDIGSRVFYRDPNDGYIKKVEGDMGIMQMFQNHTRFSSIKLYVVNEIEAEAEAETVIQRGIETVNQRGTETVQEGLVLDNEFWKKAVTQADEIETNERGTESHSEGDINQTWGDFENIDGDSLYAPSDELCSLHSSSDEDVVPQITSQFVPKRDLEKEDICLFEGMEFACAADFRTTLRHHSMKHRYDFDFKKNEGKRVTVVCANGCGWRIHASRLGKDGNFVIKKYNSEHSESCFEVRASKQASSSIIARKYVHKFRLDPLWKVGAFKGHIEDDLDLEVTRFKASRAKRKALEIIEGNYEDQFEKLREYGQLIMSSNPGSVFKVSADLEPDYQSTRFKRCFFCLDAMLKGFKEGCRPFIGLDGCFLKTPYKGQLLSAVGRDGDNSFYPIALAVVEAETKESWKWFMEELLNVLGDYHGITWISDRQKGLVEVFEDMLPRADHRYCVRHIYENFKKKFPGAMLRKGVWGAASAFTVGDFEREMDFIKRLNNEAYAWLEKVPARLWSKHKFTESSKCDLCSNNMCESWNGYIKEAREKPIIHMFEMIRRMLMKRFQEKREYMEAIEGLLVPKVQEQLKQLKKYTKRCVVDGAGLQLYEVQYGGINDSVDLGKRTCSCKEWQITGVPCMHALACILKKRFNPEEYVDPYYHKERFMKAYGHVIKPLSLRNLKKLQGVVPLIPPHIRIPPGRPKKLRKRGADEKKKIGRLAFRHRAHIKCSKCNEVGHNKRSCKNNEAGPRPPPTSKGGRPPLPKVRLQVCRGDDGTGGRGVECGWGVGSGGRGVEHDGRGGGSVGDQVIGPRGSAILNAMGGAVRLSVGGRNKGRGGVGGRGRGRSRGGHGRGGAVVNDAAITSQLREVVNVSQSQVADMDIPLTAGTQESN